MILNILLFVPIFDTFSAIARRTLGHQKISAPDKKHFHHILMNNLDLGQTGATLTIYCITAVFGFTAYSYIVDPATGGTILLLLVIIFEIFIFGEILLTSKKDDNFVIFRFRLFSCFSFTGFHTRTS